MKDLFFRYSRLGSLFLLLLSVTLEAQSNAKTNFDLSVGVHAFFLPGLKAKFTAPKPMVMLGLYRGLGEKQNLQAGLTLGYQHDPYQGNGLFAQTQIRYEPTIGKSIQPSIGTGLGYQLVFYPSSSLAWNGESWVTGKKFKGVLQVPLRLALGFKGLNSSGGSFTPYLAYQTNLLFGYSPDLSPFPVGAILGGLKFSPKYK